MLPDITCRRVAVAEIIPLRHRILRAGLPLEAAEFDHDHDPATRHYAACRGDTPLACLTLVASEWERRAAWQLRGMATDVSAQGRGLGRRLLAEAVADARATEPDRIFWCNARVSAAGFYERFGWRVLSEPFEIPTAGPHVKMVFDHGEPNGADGPTDTLKASPRKDHPECHESYQGFSGGSEAGGRRGASALALLPVVGFIAIELAFLAAVHFLGGPPWVALAVLTFFGQVIADFRLAPLFGLTPAILWAAAHFLTDNRELFFPYAMTLAVHLAGQFATRGRPAVAVAGGLVAAAFLAIRVMQAATLRVLGVEAAVTMVILVAAVAALPRVADRPWAKAAVTALASLAAFAGLAL